MFSSHLFRCGKSSSFLSKCLTLKAEQLKLTNSTHLSLFSISSDKYYSKFTNNSNSSLLSNIGVPNMQDKKYLRIPPTNKPEFDEFLGAFKKELLKFSVLDLKSAPITHLTYGVGGLLPFVLPPVQMLMFGYTDGMAWFQLAYAATILSYLGGIQWGTTIPDSTKSLPSWENLGLSVAPQLVAWISLTLPLPLGLITTSTALTATLAVDLLKQNYPPWFKSLRIFLTLGSVGALFATLFGYVAA